MFPPPPGLASGPRRRAALVLLLLLPGAVVLLLALRPLEAARIVGRARVLMEGGSLLPGGGMLLQRSLWDCGPVALHNLLLAELGSAPDPSRLARLSGTVPGGTALAGLIRAAGRSGLRLRARRVPGSALASVRPPFLAWLGEGHFVTVLEVDAAGRIVAHDPAVGAYRTSLDAFLERYGGVVADRVAVSDRSFLRGSAPGSRLRPPSTRR